MSRQAAEKLAPKAQALFAAIQNLSADGAARAELLASGVSIAVADSLYPQVFEEVAAGLIPLLNGRLGRNARSQRWQRLDEDLVASIANELLEVNSAYYAARSKAYELTPGYRAFLNVLRSKWKLGISASVEFANSLWTTYWLMEHRAKLSAQLQQQADRTLLEIFNYAFKPLPGIEA